MIFGPVHICTGLFLMRSAADACFFLALPERQGNSESVGGYVFQAEHRKTSAFSETAYFYAVELSTATFFSERKRLRRENISIHRRSLLFSITQGRENTHEQRTR